MTATTQDQTPNRVHRRDLVAYLDTLLAAREGKDYGPNGLQVEGAEMIETLVTGVSSCRELFENAAAIEAEAILVHHGLLWHGAPLPLIGVHYRRLAVLFKNKINLLAYHLPLDRHPKFGNNAIAARALGLVELSPFAEFDGNVWGFSGRLTVPLTIEALSQRCRDLYQQEPQVFAAGRREIRRVGVVSGAGEKALHQAIEGGLDAFITGEVSEWVMNVAKESRTHFLSVGHYASERLGVQALGDHLRDHFGIQVEFIDVPNPV